VYTFFRFAAVFILIFFLLLCLLGLFGPGETSFSIGEQIGSPATVVWRTLINADKTAEWDNEISRIVISGGKRYGKNVELSFYLSGNRNEIAKKEKISGFDPEKGITFEEVPYQKKLLLKNHKRSYQLKSLLDGSTEIQVFVSYSAGSFITRALDRIYLKSHIMNKHRAHLRNLKRYIENQ